MPFEGCEGDYSMKVKGSDIIYRLLNDSARNSQFPASLYEKMDSPKSVPGIHCKDTECLEMKEKISSDTKGTTKGTELIQKETWKNMTFPHYETKCLKVDSDLDSFKDLSMETLPAFKPDKKDESDCHCNKCSYEVDNDTTQIKDVYMHSMEHEPTNYKIRMELFHHEKGMELPQTDLTDSTDAVSQKQRIFKMEKDDKNKKIKESNERREAIEKDFLNKSLETGTSQEDENKFNDKFSTEITEKEDENKFNDKFSTEITEKDSLSIKSLYSETSYDDKENEGETTLHQGNELYTEKSFSEIEFFIAEKENFMRNTGNEEIETDLSRSFFLSSEYESQTLPSVLISSVEFSLINDVEILQALECDPLSLNSFSWEARRSLECALNDLTHRGTDQTAYSFPPNSFESSYSNTNVLYDLPDSLTSFSGYQVYQDVSSEDCPIVLYHLNYFKSLNTLGKCKSKFSLGFIRPSLSGNFSGSLEFLSGESDTQEGDDDSKTDRHLFTHSIKSVSSTFLLNIETDKSEKKKKCLSRVTKPKPCKKRNLRDGSFRKRYHERNEKTKILSFLTGPKDQRKSGKKNNGHRKPSWKRDKISPNPYPWKNGHHKSFSFEGLGQESPVAQLKRAKVKARGYMNDAGKSGTPGSSQGDQTSQNSGQSNGEQGANRNSNGGNSMQRNNGRRDEDEENNRERGNGRNPHETPNSTGSGRRKNDNDTTDLSLPPPKLDAKTIELRIAKAYKIQSKYPENWDPPFIDFYFRQGNAAEYIPVASPEGGQDIEERREGEGGAAPSEWLQSTEHANREHATIPDTDILDIIGMATNGLPLSLPASMGHKFNLCLSHAMHDLSLACPNSDTSSQDACVLCLILSNLLTHLAQAECSSLCSVSSRCEPCAQMFNLIVWHANLCMGTKRRRSRVTKSDLCYKVCKNSNWIPDKLASNMNRLKIKIRKYCAKVLCPLESEPESLQTDRSTGLSEVAELASTSSPLLSHSSAHLTISGNIVTMPEEEGGTQPNVITSSTGHAGQNSITYASVPEHHQAHLSGSKGLPQGHQLSQGCHGMMTVMPANPILPSTGPLSRGEPLTCIAAEAPGTPFPGDAPTTSHTRLTRKPSGARAKPVAIPQPIVEEKTPAESEATGRNVPDPPKDDIAALIYSRFGKNDDPYETQRTYGIKDRIESMPMGDVHDVEQFMSVWARPKGMPGIGEVVFAHPSQLKIVAGFWERKREECERTHSCPYHHLEEGVILAEHKDKFRLLRTRYQKHQQWERVAHLGNGMSGKCHLAMDLKTRFMFCVKKIHLLRYEEEELSLWCEIHHPYVVRLYGAIRHGVKIYIFSEFIDGGNLASCIAEQRLLGRRLSHWNAINYFQQLLNVLAYLQSKNMLHEDIKADNILLRQNSTFMALTDFGTSRRLRDPKELKNKSPVGSPTHWSPEKASMEGHGFPSDLWASLCVLVHMLSGEPPWVRRYMNRAAILNFVIYAHPPPMEDVPSNVQAVVRDLIQKGFIKQPEHRPSASEMLQHPAFSMLDEGTPENYYSTLVSQSHWRQLDNNQSTENSEGDAANTLLYSSEIPVGTCQESDKRLEAVGRERGSCQGSDKKLEDNETGPNTALSGGTNSTESRGSVTDIDLSNRTPATVTNTALPGSGNTLTAADETNVIVDNRAGSSSRHDDREEKAKAEGGLIPGQNDNIIDKAEIEVVDEHDSKGAKQPQKEQSSFHELINPDFDLEKLIPRFDEIWPSSGESDTSSSVRSFLTDNYNSVIFNQRERNQLQVFEPETSTAVGRDELPKLSIFNFPQDNAGSASQQVPSRSGLSQTPHNASMPAQSQTPKPSPEKEENPSELPAPSEPQKDQSKRSSPRLNPLLSGCYTDTESRTIMFQLSTESEFSSADMFETPEVEDILGIRKESVGNTSPPASPVSPGSHLHSPSSTYSSHSPQSSLQQRKPTNLKLDISSPPSSNTREGPTTSQGVSKKVTSHRGSSASDGSVSSFQQTPSTGRLTSSLKAGTSTSSSTGSYFHMSMSVHEEQEKQLKEFKEEMESQHSSGEDNFLYFSADMFQGKEEENVPSAQEHDFTDTQSILETLQGEFEGHKLIFYNAIGAILFDARVQELPVYWKYFIDRVRQILRELHYEHFVLQHMDGTLVDLLLPCMERELRVLAMPEANVKECCCNKCHFA